LSSVGLRIPSSSKINCEIHTNFLFSFLFSSIFCNVSVIYSCSSNVSESRDEFLTSFEAESKGKTDSQDLWLS
jgi:hypothetical protein